MKRIKMLLISVMVTLFNFITFNNRVKFQPYTGSSIEDFMGDVAETYYGESANDLLGDALKGSQVDTETISHGAIIRQRSITPFKKGDFLQLINTTRSTDGDPVDYAKSVVSAGSTATVTVNEALLTRRSAYALVYVVIAIPYQLKAKHVLTISLSATDKTGRAGSTEVVRVITKDDKDPIIPLINFVTTSSAPQPLNMEVAASTLRTISVTVNGLPDEAVVTLVLPGATDGIRLAFERWVTSI